MKIRWVIWIKRQNTFNEERKKLRQYHKQLNVGLVKEEDIPEHYKKLLVKYYGH